MPKPKSFILEEQVPLAPYTTMGLGGPARYFARLRTPEDLAPALEFAQAADLPVWVLGGGSNVVFADAGFAGLVLLPDWQQQFVEKSGTQLQLTAQAGIPFDRLVTESVAQGYGTLAPLSGIPGSVGAAPIQNIGAYGMELADCLLQVEVFDLASGARRTLPKAALNLGYRTSLFKGQAARRPAQIVTAVTLQLQRCANMPVPAYGPLPELLGSHSSPAALRAQILALRGSKGMWLGDAGTKVRSCGSFFINPTLSTAQLQSLSANLQQQPPHYALPDGQVKVPAAWLLEQCGLRKGWRVGNVGISPYHALALTSYAGASAQELVAFAAQCARQVHAKTGLWLRPEPVLADPQGESAWPLQA